MTNRKKAGYSLVKQRKSYGQGQLEDIRIEGDTLSVLSSEHYVSMKDDWTGIIKFSRNLDFQEKYGYGHNHSSWKKMAYFFDDITQDKDKSHLRKKLIEFAAKAYHVTETAVLLNPDRFLYPIRDMLDEEYKKEVFQKKGILVKPVAFDVAGSLSFIVDHDQSTVYRYDDGKYAGRFGDIGIGNGAFLYPSDIKILDDVIHVLDFPTVPGEYFEDKPSQARVQRFSLKGEYLGQAIMQNLRLKPSEWGQTSFEVTGENVYVANNHDFYVRGKDGCHISDLHINKSRITKLRANDGILGIGFYELGGILFLDTSSGEPRGFLETKHSKYRYMSRPNSFDFRGDEVYVTLDDAIQKYNIKNHLLPQGWDSGLILK